MAIKGLEVERRFPVEPKVFKEVEKELQKAKEYQNIIDTYYVFNLLKKIMVRARSVEQTFPAPQAGMRYQLCAKELFSPAAIGALSKDGEHQSIFELNEVNVNIDDFKNLEEIFNLIKEQEFTIKGNRRYYRVPNYSGPFSSLYITTDYVENLKHNHWVEIEIFLDEAKQSRFNEAINEICKIAIKGFRMPDEFIRSPSVFPTYPEIYFWENWYYEEWTKNRGKIANEFDYASLEESIRQVIQ